MSEQPTLEMDETVETLESERRASPRLELTVPVTVNSVTSFLGRSGDLSAGGMYVELDEVLPVGSLIDLGFRIPGVGRRFEVLGEVRWTHASAGRGSGHGVEFLDLPAEGGRALRRHLDTYDSVCEAVCEVANSSRGVALV